MRVGEIKSTATRAGVTKTRQTALKVGEINKETTATTTDGDLVVLSDLRMIV